MSELKQWVVMHCITTHNMQSPHSRDLAVACFLQMAAITCTVIFRQKFAVLELVKLTL